MFHAQECHAAATDDALDCSCHDPACEALCTEGADCNCGAAPPRAQVHIANRRICDPIAELSRLLRESGARVTFDPERSIAKPCMVCGTTEQSRDLVQIGTFTRPLGGHQPGDPITRPMCAACEELTRPAAAAPVLPSGGEDPNV